MTGTTDRGPDGETPPIPREELDDLVRRIESAGGEGGSEMIESEPDGDRAERRDYRSGS